MAHRAAVAGIPVVHHAISSMLLFCCHCAALGGLCGCCDRSASKSSSVRGRSTPFFSVLLLPFFGGAGGCAWLGSRGVGGWVHRAVWFLQRRRRRRRRAAGGSQALAHPRTRLPPLPLPILVLLTVVGAFGCCSFVSGAASQRGERRALASRLSDAHVCSWKVLRPTDRAGGGPKRPGATLIAELRQVISRGCSEWRSGAASPAHGSCELQFEAPRWIDHPLCSAACRAPFFDLSASTPVQLDAAPTVPASQPLSQVAGAKTAPLRSHMAPNAALQQRPCGLQRPASRPSLQLGAERQAPRRPARRGPAAVRAEGPAPTKDEVRCIGRR